MDDLIEQGVYEQAGLDESGTDTLTLNLERAKAVAPDIYWQELNAIDQAILDAIDEGFLEIDYTAENGIEYVLTPKGEALL